MEGGVRKVWFYCVGRCIILIVYYHGYVVARKYPSYRIELVERHIPLRT
jgi:hypothetical protein